MEQERIVINMDQDELAFELTTAGLKCSLSVVSLNETATAEVVVPEHALRRLEKALATPGGQEFRWSAEGHVLIRMCWMEGDFCRAYLWNNQTSSQTGSEPGNILFADLEPEEVARVCKLIQSRPREEHEDRPSFGLAPKEEL